MQVIKFKRYIVRVGLAGVSYLRYNNTDQLRLCGYEAAHRFESLHKARSAVRQYYRSRGMDIGYHNILEIDRDESES